MKSFTHSQNCFNSSAIIKMSLRQEGMNSDADPFGEEISSLNYHCKTATSHTLNVGVFFLFLIILSQDYSKKQSLSECQNFLRQ